MPGFINAHHHIYSALARGLSLPGPAPTNFGEILEGLWFYLDNKLTAPDVKASALLTYLGCIENGVTTILTTMQVMVKFLTAYPSLQM